jgi:sec-independent protein translocase protein TatB
MFNFAWSEIALIGVVALIAIGPKDLPGAMKALAQMIKKARRLAAEFQSHVDEMLREAELGELRQHIQEIRSLDLTSTLTKTVDPDGTIRRTLSEDPLAAASSAATSSAATAALEVEAKGAAMIAPPALADGPDAGRTDEGRTGEGRAGEGGAGDAAEDAPDFIPPAIARRRNAPAFIPPRRGRRHTPFP